MKNTKTTNGHAPSESPIIHGDQAMNLLREIATNTKRKPKSDVLTPLQFIVEKLPPTIETLNAAKIFCGRIPFLWTRRRGGIIQAGFADGHMAMAQWFSGTDLRTFARSQDILFEATGFLIPTPSHRYLRPVWEPIAQLIRDIADQDAIDLEPALKDEFEGIIRSTWIRAGRPYVSSPDEFFAILRDCQREGRKHLADAPPRCCVWAGGIGESAPQYCWVYPDALVEWLSAHHGKGKYYQWDDVRKALLMLGFAPIRLHRSLAAESLTVRVWKAKIDLLVDDDSLEVTEIK